MPASPSKTGLIVAAWQGDKCGIQCSPGARTALLPQGSCTPLPQAISLRSWPRHRCTSASSGARAREVRRATGERDELASRMTFVMDATVARGGWRWGEGVGALAGHCEPAKLKAASPARQRQRGSGLPVWFVSAHGGGFNPVVRDRQALSRSEGEEGPDEAPRLQEGPGPRPTAAAAMLPGTRPVRLLRFGRRHRSHAGADGRGLVNLCSVPWRLRQFNG